MPPSIPVTKLFPNGGYPEGELQSYKDDQRWRETDEEKRELDRLYQDLYEDVRQGVRGGAGALHDASGRISTCGRAPTRSAVEGHLRMPAGSSSQFHIQSLLRTDRCVVVGAGRPRPMGRMGRPSVHQTVGASKGGEGAGRGQSGGRIVDGHKIAPPGGDAGFRGQERGLKTPPILPPRATNQPYANLVGAPDRNPLSPPLPPSDPSFLAKVLPKSKGPSSYPTSPRAIGGTTQRKKIKKAKMYIVRTDGFTCTKQECDTDEGLQFSQPFSQQQMLIWEETPRRALLLVKLGGALVEEMREIIRCLEAEGVTVVIESHEMANVRDMPGVETFGAAGGPEVDFCVCLGGDGVIMHASNLFPSQVPPVVAFNLGSMGFLTNHIFGEHVEDLRQVIHGDVGVGGVYVTLRMRLRCDVMRGGVPVRGLSRQVLNEVVVDRGTNPYLSLIEVYERDRLVTKVQADGLMLATPTGSTAYSVAAGGSMVHPNVPAILFTPICPHTLSFRPVILPDSAEIELRIPEDARSTAWASFDGKHRYEIQRGESLRVTMSSYPLTTINKCDQTNDWFGSLVRCLNWNERIEQKSFGGNAGAGEGPYGGTSEGPYGSAGDGL